MTKKRNKKGKKKGSVSDALRKSVDNSVEERSSEGTGYGILNFSNLDVSTDELPFFKPNKGKNRIDVIPFWVETDKHPSESARKNGADYRINVHVHKGLGPDRNKTLICLEETYGKPCPVCEKRRKLQEQGASADLIKMLKPQYRVLYNVIDLDNEEKGIQIMDVAYYSFERNIVDDVTDGKKGRIYFPDLENGSTIIFKAKPSKFQGHSFMKILEGSFALEDREEAYEESIVDEAFKLDEMLIVPTYEEAKKLVNMVSDEDMDEDEDDDDWDDDDDNEVEEEEDDFDDDDDDWDDDDEDDYDDDDDWDDDDDNEVEEEEDDFDDDDDDEIEEEPKKSVKRKKSTTEKKTKKPAKTKSIKSKKTKTRNRK
ncbi:MAG: hypothetical protein PVI88_00420 [Nitrosopumilaceae archaeon]